MQVKTRGIILKTTKYGEADLIVQMLTEDSIPMTFIAKSALRSKKRFGGGVLEPSHCVVATYQQKGNADNQDRMAVLSEANLENGFDGLRSDYGRLELAMYFLKLVQKVTNEGDAHERSLFNLLGHSLRAAETSESLPILRAHFEIKMLEQQGVLPHESLFGPFIERSVRDHQDIQISVEDLRALRPRLDFFIRQYTGI